MPSQSNQCESTSVKLESDLICQCFDQNTRFANRSRRFMDAYARGLNGRQAAWAARKYKGHRVLPESLMRDLDAANVL